MLNWFWKWMGWHVCEDFTEWKQVEGRWWFYRNCKVCGRAQKVGHL